MCKIWAFIQLNIDNFSIKKKYVRQSLKIQIILFICRLQFEHSISIDKIVMISQNTSMSQVWWYTPMIVALERLRQEVSYKFQAGQTI